ncbi:MAG: hypothetical protein ABIJ35_05675 [Acidobacteriota bacterium]
MEPVPETLLSRMGATTWHPLSFPCDKIAEYRKTVPFRLAPYIW